MDGCECVPAAELVMVEGKCTLWDPDAALLLRSEHRLMGNFAGRRRPGTKSGPTMPIVLMDEEASLALSRGWAVLKGVSEPGSEGSGADAGASTSESMLGKRNRLAVDDARVGDDRGGGGGGGGGGGQRVEIPMIPARNFGHVPAASFRFPQSDKQSTRNRVFEDLHGKGFWLTGALKFGGDFLAYKGDPRHHHAEYIVVAVARDEPIQASLLVSLGRVGAAASKSGLVATVAGNGCVEYSSIRFSPYLEPGRRRPT